MGTATAARILLCTTESIASAELRELLEKAGHHVTVHALASTDMSDPTCFSMILISGNQVNNLAFQLCRRIRALLADKLVPLLLIGGEAGTLERFEGLAAGADVFLSRPFSDKELLAQVESLARLKRLHDRAAEKSVEFNRVNKRLEQAYQQIDQELTLACRIQHSMLPKTLPEMPPIRFAVHYRPCGKVGGDFYDVFRLDEDHVGFYIADVMGHGVPAGLLTIYLKMAVKAKEIFGRDYRLLPPDQVLHNLNRDMIAQALAENPFITMIYGLYSRRHSTLTFARAGHPHPLYLPCEGPPEPWKVHGTLLGIFDTQFSVLTRQLRPGDKVLFHTDGLDNSGEESQIAASDRLAHYATQHRELAISELTARVAHDLTRECAQADDFTLLGLEIASAS